MAMTQGHWRYGEDGLGEKEDLQQLENEIRQQHRVIVEKIEVKGRTNMMVRVRDRWASEEGAVLARATVSESDHDVRAQDVWLSRLSGHRSFAYSVDATSHRPSIFH